jgi:penicillin-binding protein 1B
MRRILWGSAFAAFPLVFLLATIVGWQFYRELENEVVARFSSHQWEVPSKIYAEPLLLYPGVRIDAETLFAHLARLDYRPVSEAIQARGEYLYAQKTGSLQLSLRDSPFVQPIVHARRVSLLLREGRVERLTDLDEGSPLPFVELEPEVVAGVYDRAWGERRVCKLF